MSRRRISRRCLHSKSSWRIAQARYARQVIVSSTPCVLLSIAAFHGRLPSIVINSCLGSSGGVMASSSGAALMSSPVATRSSWRRQYCLARNHRRRCLPALARGCHASAINRQQNHKMPACRPVAHERKCRPASKCAADMTMMLTKMRS